MHLPGYLLDKSELEERGFAPLRLEFKGTEIHLPEGIGCEWTTVGTVPDSPGLYAFTAQRDANLSVAYVGMTEHLWMVTKGRLPNGASRPAQRYGRPRYAGVTRQRINIEISHLTRVGITVCHWVCPVPHQGDGDVRDNLRSLEAALISRWQLRSHGWNRG